MTLKIRKGQAILGIALSLLLFISACAGTVSEYEQESQQVQPVVVITQLITPVVATPISTSVPPPTKAPEAPVQPVSSVGWDPLAVQIYYPIRGCVASRIFVGDVAYVANGAGVLGIHQTKDIGYAPIWRHLTAGETMDIVKGPWCDQGSLIWKVATADGYIGFVPEGNGEIYWLLPMPPNTERVLSAKEFRLRQILPPGETLDLVSPKAYYCR